MKNKIKLFDRGTFIEAINRLKIPGIIMGVIFISSGLIQLLNCVLELKQYRYVTVAPEYFYITYLIPFVLVPMMMMVAFSYLRVRKTSDFYHALPVKRETLYGSTIFAALAWIVAELFIASLIPLIMAMVSPFIKIDMVIFGETIAKALVTSILVLAGFSMGVSLTGNGFTNFFVALLILFVPRTISTIITSMAEQFTPFLVLNVTSSLINNQYNIIFREMSLFGNTIPLLATVIYSLILAAIYFVVGGVAFVKRKSELAGKPSAFRGVQVAARMILPFISLLGALFFFMYWSRFYTDEIVFLFFAFSCVTTAFTAYFIYELITVRKIKKVLKSLAWFPVLVGGVVIVGIIISIGSRIAMNRKIDADKIKYLMIEDLSGWNMSDEFDRLENEKAYEIIANAYAKQLEKYSDFNDYADCFDAESDTNVTVGVNQGGTTFYRVVSLSYDDYCELYKICKEEIYSKITSIELPKYNGAEVYFDYYNFSMSDERKIYEVLAEEIKGLSWEEVNDYGADEFVTFVTIYGYSYQYGTKEMYIPISSATPKTLEVFIEAMINGEALMYGEEVYNKCLKYYNDGYTLDVNMYDCYVICDNKIFKYIDYAGTYAEDDMAKETVELFKNIEESEDGDNVIILCGSIEMGDPRGDYYQYIDTVDLENIYYVTDEVLEQFLEYIDEIQYMNELEYME